MTRKERIVHAMAPTANLFLLITLPEIRREGITYLALYALERTVEESIPYRGMGYPVEMLRQETGLPDFEVSRACSLLKRSGLVRISRLAGDGRKRLLISTERGVRVLHRILSRAAGRLWDGILPPGRIRRVRNATASLRRTNEILHGMFQPSFFDRDLNLDQEKKKPSARRRKASPGTPSRKKPPRRKGLPSFFES